MYKDRPRKITSPTYLSYMVRLWHSAGSHDWLASLEAPGTHEQHNFSDLVSFFTFLQAQTGSEQAVQRTTEQGKINDHSSVHAEPP